MQVRNKWRRCEVAGLVMVLVLALGLRFVGLDRVPPAVFGDELDVGYQAFSLWRTGRDYSGQWLPSYIRSFSEWRTPLLMYVTAPFVGILGMNEWGLRVPDALLGVITVGLVYWLTKRLWGRWEIALAAGVCLATSPWHLQYSRSAFEASLLVFLLTFAVASFLKGVEEGRKGWLVLSGMGFSLTFYTYSTANVFTPLVLILLIMGSWRRVKALSVASWLPAVLVLFILSLPMMYNLFFGHAAERYGKFSVFSDTNLIDQINRDRTVAGDTILEKLVHNKPLVWGRRIVANYFTGLSPQFLFIDGDVTFRHSIHQIGELFWIQVPLILIGVYQVVRKREKYGWLVLGWLILAPIPTSLTWDGQVHATRLILLLVPLTLLTAYGFGYVADWVRRGGRMYRWLVVLGAVVFLLECGLYLHRYWVHYPLESWRWWHYGYKEGVSEMEKYEDKYKMVVMNDTYEPALVRFLFWTAYDPKKFQSEFVWGSDTYKAGILPGFDGFFLADKYYFGKVENGKIGEFLTSDVLYLASQKEDAGGDWDWRKSAPGGVRVLSTVVSLTGEPVFFLVTEGK